jgi:YVTN family beta-propeller protein
MRSRIVTHAVCIPAAAAAIIAVAWPAAATAPPGQRPGTVSPPTAYVVDTGSVALSDTVTPINTATNIALKAIKVGYGPDAIAITPDGKTAYVVSGAQTCGTCSHVPPPADTVTPIRTATNTALKAIKVGIHPDAIAITPNGKTAYVLNSGSGTSGPGTVTPINTATNTALKPITVGKYPVAIAITPNGKTAYVVNLFSSTVTPIRTATNTALKAIRIGKPVGVGTPTTIVITPNGKTAYVADNSTLPGKVTPISVAANTALKPIDVGSGPGAMAITPNGRTLYVLTDSGVTPVSTATNTAGKKIPLTGLFSNIAITPNGRTAYIVNDVFEPGDTPGTVIPLHTATGKVGRPIPVGIGPGAIAITP